jgi:hypothetical protein
VGVAAVEALSVAVAAIVAGAATVIAVGLAGRLLPKSISSQTKDAVLLIKGTVGTTLLPVAVAVAVAAAQDRCHSLRAGVIALQDWSFL